MPCLSVSQVCSSKSLFPRCAVQKIDNIMPQMLDYELEGGHYSSIRISHEANAFMHLGKDIQFKSGSRMKTFLFAVVQSF